MTIGGLVGGTAGQVLHIRVVSNSNAVTLEHAEGGGNEDIYLGTAADESKTSFGGWTLVFDGTTWYGE